MSNRPDEQFSWYGPPVPTVRRIIAVITEAIVLTGRNGELTMFPGFVTGRSA